MTFPKDDLFSDGIGNGGEEEPDLPDPEHYRFLKVVRVPFYPSEAPEGLRNFLVEGRRVRLVPGLPSRNEPRLIHVECQRGPFRGMRIGSVSCADSEKWASRMDEGICLAGWIGPEDSSPDRIRIAVYERILFPVENLTSFEFRQDGFFRPCITVKISFREKSLIYRKTVEPGDGPVQQVVIRFYPRKWETFVLPAIRKCNLPAWRMEYVDPCVCDGVRWSMILRFSSGRRRRILGSNDFPEEWDHFQSFLEECLDMRDVKGSGAFSILPPASPDGL